MSKNGLTIFKKLPFCAFLLFTIPPSVFAQKIIKVNQEPPMLIRVGVGVHRIWETGPLGGHISFNCEDPINSHLSWTANFIALVNPVDLALPPDTRSSYQMRLVIQPDFRYYPSHVLRHFFVGGGLGIVAGQGKSIGALPNGKTQLHIFGEALSDIKIGWQTYYQNRYVWNAFASSGLLLPLNGDKKIPIFRLGFQVGL
ncbi:MAG: hypothetical protein JNL70_24050 [Saprospiraceae bacterium]|nr:hypothetical protein [Saprospiraceae bacterium]